MIRWYSSTGFRVETPQEHPSNDYVRRRLGPPQGQRGSVRDFIEFREFATPSLLVLSWALGVAIITAVSLFTFVGYGSSAANPLAAIVTFVVGNLIWRVWIEVLVVLFRIYGSLQTIARALTAKG